MKGTVEIYQLRRTPNGTEAMRRDGVYEMLQEGRYDIDRSKFLLLSLDREMAEDLATELSHRSVKPKDSSFTEGKLQATESHLADMRKLLKLC